MLQTAKATRRCAEQVLSFKHSSHFRGKSAKNNQKPPSSSPNDLPVLSFEYDQKQASKPTTSIIKATLTSLKLKPTKLVTTKIEQNQFKTHKPHLKISQKPNSQNPPKSHGLEFLSSQFQFQHRHSRILNLFIAFREPAFGARWAQRLDPKAYKLVARNVPVAGDKCTVGCEV